MSIGDMLKGALGQIEAAAVPAILNEVLSKTDVGGLQGIVQKLQAAGFGTQVQSWLGNGTNMPITTDQLRDALNSDQVRQIASHFGVNVDEALKILAQHLPTAVDQASPNGKLEPGEPRSN
jgi:uncharacterized protein YidB (DUF937 family)